MHTTCTNCGGTINKVIESRTLFYIINPFAHIYICMRVCLYIYMLAIADQTAEPNWLNFLREPIRGCKKSNLVSQWHVCLLYS